MTTTTTTLTAEQYGAEVTEAVLADMRAGRVPDDGTVQTFADLHDHVDANEYLIAVHERHGLPVLTEDGSGDYVDLDNAACAFVTAWLDRRMLDHRRRIRKFADDHIIIVKVP